MAPTTLAASSLSIAITIASASSCGASTDTASAEFSKSGSDGTAASSNTDEPSSTNSKRRLLHRIVVGSFDSGAQKTSPQTCSGPNCNLKRRGGGGGPVRTPAATTCGGENSTSNRSQRSAHRRVSLFLRGQNPIRPRRSSRHQRKTIKNR